MPVLIIPLLIMFFSECGGLQTLLRNHNYIFVIESGGRVRLRCPIYDDISVGKRKRKRNSSSVIKNNTNKSYSTEQFKKTKQCWLHENHPQGCPIASANCLWAHGDNDLRNSP